MSEFKPGEIVDITIKGARVDEVSKNGIHVVMPNGTTASIELSNYDGVAVERVAPAEWPPQPGDLWRDRGDEAWFAFRDKGVLLLIPSYPISASRGGCKPEAVLESLGPLTLVYREGGEAS